MNLEGFRADILAEPDALHRLAETYGGPGSPLDRLPLARRVVFLGMGSSRYAALSAAARLRREGIDAHAEHASTEEGQPAAEDTLAIAISAGGRSAETLDAARRHGGRGRLAAITNDPGSELAAMADVVLPLLAGDEAGGIACRSYQATVAVLLLVCARLCGRELPLADLHEAAGAQRELFERRDAWLPRLAAAMDGGAGIWVAAPAERIGSALQASLMLREAPRIVSAGCETGDWSHVDVYLTKRPGYRLLLLTGSRYEPELLDWRRRRGFALAAIGSPVPGAAVTVELGTRNEVQTSLVEVSVAELLAAELWRRHPI